MVFYNVFGAFLASFMNLALEFRELLEKRSQNQTNQANQHDNNWLYPYIYRVLMSYIF